MTNVWKSEWRYAVAGWVLRRTPSGGVSYSRCDKYLKLPSGAVETCPRMAVWQRERVSRIAGMDFRHYDNRCDWHTPKGVNVADWQ